jgi:hypothetical protein
MSELGGDSGRSALQRVIAKINDSRPDARISSSPEGAELVRSSKDDRRFLKIEGGGHFAID